MLLDLFSRRAPTSLFASACDHSSLFLLKAALTPEARLVHLPDLDAVVAIRIDANTLILLDIVAPEIPTLETFVHISTSKVTASRCISHPTAWAGGRRDGIPSTRDTWSVDHSRWKARHTCFPLCAFNALSALGSSALVCRECRLSGSKTGRRRWRLVHGREFAGAQTSFR